MKPGIRQIRKRPFLIFTIITGSLLLSALIFIQSRRFADIVKGAIVRYIPEDLGVVGNFSEFEVSFMPPGVSILNPELKLGEKNLLSLPEGSTVSAKRLGLYFYPLQMLTGKIRVQELLIADGKVHLLLDLKALKARKPAKPDTKLDWKQLFQVKADALSLEHIDLDVEVTDPALKAALTVDHLRVAQDVSRSGPGYDMDLEFRTIEGEYPEAWRVPHSIDRVMLQAFVNATGVDLRRAEVSTGGFEAKAGGRLKGDVLDPKKLLLSSDTELRGDVGKALALLGVEADAGGNFEYRGRLSADLMNVGTTLGLGGKFSADKVHYGKWYADRVEIDGQTETEGDFANTAIKVNRVMLSSERTERQGGHHPGSGGKVEFEPFTFHPNMKDPIEVTAHLEDAHIHWLAAGGIKDVYPMDFRVSGPLKAHFDPPVEGHPWAARAELGFHIPRFTLDNQKFDKEKKLSTLLDVAELKLEGGVKVGPTGIVPDGLVLSMPHTRFAVGGDLVFGRGYGLDIQGPVDMVDFKTLSGKEIQGRGTLHTRVTGPSSRVFIDFEPRLDGAFYLGLKVGDIRDGHLVWDDDPGDLIFKSLHIQKGITDYTVNGKLNLGIPEEKGSLDVDVAGGSISDFTGIFENLTKDLWWFPSSLTGPLQGNLTL
ncbi:MAG TPA: hypothetical protein VL588_08160, partial [Bdellovibrionota bacterium]|nr:hypothetical protein [Bdellovibrionota bacterium]